MGKQVYKCYAVKHIKYVWIFLQLGLQAGFSLPKHELTVLVKLLCAFKTKNKPRLQHGGGEQNLH